MGFNRSLHIESRVDRLTGDPGAVLLREIVEQSGIIGWMTARLTDPRSQVDVTHDLASLIRTGVLLAAQGWRDHDDADALRHDPAFRTGDQFGCRADAAERSWVGVAADAVTLHCADGRAREPQGPARGGAGAGRARHQGRSITPAEPIAIANTENAPGRGAVTRSDRRIEPHKTIFPQIADPR